MNHTISGEIAKDSNKAKCRRRGGRSIGCEKEGRREERIEEKEMEGEVMTARG